jgi:probable addiction module antidote protein
MPITKSKSPNSIPSHVSGEDATIQMFRDDPDLAAEYLNQVLADGDQQELLLAMRYLANAFGGVVGVAKASQLNARTLYRTLSEHGNPELETFTSLLKAMGLRLAVAPIERRSIKTVRTGL